MWPFPATVTLHECSLTALFSWIPKKAAPHFSSSPSSSSALLLEELPLFLLKLWSTRKKAAYWPLFPRPCRQLVGLRPTCFLFFPSFTRSSHQSPSSSLPSPRSSLWSLRSPLWSLRSPLWSQRSSLWSQRSSLWSPRSSIWSPMSSLWSPRSSLWSPRSSLWSPRSSLWSPTTKVLPLVTKVFKKVWRNLNHKAGLKNLWNGLQTFHLYFWAPKI